MQIVSLVTLSTVAMFGCAAVANQSSSDVPPPPPTARPEMPAKAQIHEITTVCDSHSMMLSYRDYGSPGRREADILRSEISNVRLMYREALVDVSEYLEFAEGSQILFVSMECSEDPTAYIKIVYRDKKDSSTLIGKTLAVHKGSVEWQDDSQISHIRDLNAFVQ